MILGPVFGVDGRRGTSAKALKASKGAGARISSDYLATPPVPKFASSGYGPPAAFIGMFTPSWLISGT